MEGFPVRGSADARCRRCGTPFLAFRRGVPCPSCGIPSDDAVPIVDAVLRTYEENMRATGRPIPAMIRVQSLWDDYLYRGLFLLKALDGRRPRESEEAVLTRLTDLPNGSVGPGWRGHVLDFYREVLRTRAARAEKEK